MRGRLPHNGAVRSFRQLQRQSIGQSTRRAIQISATPTTDSPNLSGDVLSNAIETSADAADARFEVLGAPFSLLSVSLSASQKLYTRRGTLVGVSGKAENTQSTLSMLEPIRRALFGIPFLYQRVTSTSPITALISTKSPLTSFHVLHLNGTVDYMIAQRKALLAWTGHTLSVSPTVNTKLGLAHWGNTEVTGRGLVALAGPGQLYEINLRAGEEYVAYPGNVVAYTITQNLPQPYRFKSSNLRFQIPSLGLGRLTRDVKFFRVMKGTNTWRTVTGLLYSIRTAARRTIWGDRLFLRFQGPTTILVSSRASRISDVLTSRDVNEIADAPAGAVQNAVVKASTPVEEPLKQIANAPVGFRVAQVSNDGSVKIKDAESVGKTVRS